MAQDNGIALDYLADCIYDAVLWQPGAVRPANLVGSLPGDLRVSVGLLRKHLASDDRFVEVNGRYDIAERDALALRPFGGVITALLRGYGRPMSAPLLARALARIRGGSPSGARKLLDEFVSGRDTVMDIEGHVILEDWLLRVQGETDEEMLFYNGLQGDENLQRLWDGCKRRKVRKRNPVNTAASILESFKEPIDVVQLALLTWSLHPQGFDPVEFFGGVVADDQIGFVHGPRCVTDRLLAAATRQLHKLSEKATAKDEVLPPAELAALLAEDPPEGTVDYLKEDDADNVLEIVSNARAPIGINELLADVLELKPNARKYKVAAHALRELFDTDLGLTTTSAGYYLARDAVPGWISTVPDELVPEPLDPEEDVLLAVEGLHETLQPAVVDPSWEDVLSGIVFEVEDSQLTRDRLTYPLLYHHHLAGTMAVREIDREFFAGDQPISMLTLRTAEGDSFSVWLNREIGLLLGMSAWYSQSVYPAGAVITIDPTDTPGEFVLGQAARKNAAVAIEAERLAELEELRERVAMRPTTVFELLVRLVGDNRSGIRFDALWSEANAVRRTTRWQIASALSWFKCFDYVGGKTQGWKFVSDRINDGGDEALTEFVIAGQLAEDAEDVDELAELEQPTEE